MNYEDIKYYRKAYGIMLIILIPFFVLLSVKKGEYKSPIIVIFIAIIVGTEYSYTFPRQAMKLYEKILYKSLIEKINYIIQLFILIGFSLSEIFYFIKENSIKTYLPIVIFITIYLLWSFIIHNQSILIGDKSIMVGRVLIPHSSIKSISETKNIISIETDKKVLKLYKLALGSKKMS